MKGRAKTVPWPCPHKEPPDSVDVNVAVLDSALEVSDELCGTQDGLFGILDLEHAAFVRRFGCGSDTAYLDGLDLYALRASQTSAHLTITIHKQYNRHVLRI